MGLSESQQGQFKSDFGNSGDNETMGSLCNLSSARQHSHCECYARHKFRTPTGGLLHVPRNPSPENVRDDDIPFTHVENMLKVAKRAEIAATAFSAPATGFVKKHV